MDYPGNQMEFEKMFLTEKQCLDYIAKVRWSNGFICPKCNCSEHWPIVRDLIMCKNCNYQVSSTAGTIFHRSKKPLTFWFMAIWWIVAQKNGVSALGLKRILGLGSYRTAWIWLHKFRRLMVIPDRDKLSGKVEVDETFIGGKKAGKRGRGAYGKVLVAIGVEIKGEVTGRIRLSIIPDASGKSLETFICNNIKQGACIVTDDWNGYNNIKRLGYEHKIENKTVLFDGIEILPHVHKIASLLKRWLLGTHQNYVSKDKLEYYLDEFTFRYNRRTSKSRGLLFYRLIEQAVIHKPVLYNDIIENTGVT